MSLDTLLLACSDLIAANQPLFLGLFLAGLLGGLTHCALQCGPLVVSMTESQPSLNRLGGIASLPYHLGRTVTYVLLAVAVALTGQILANLPFGYAAPILLALTAAILFLIAGLQRIGAPLPDMQMPQWLHRSVSSASGLFQKFGRFPLGMAMGLMPCAMSGGAIFAAGATGDPAAAATAMFVFGLGTAAALIPITNLLNHLMHRGPWSAKLSGALRLFNAGLLFTLAGQILIEGA